MKSKFEFVVLLSTLFACAGCQSEIAKWEFARGLNEAADGQPDSGLDLMKQAVEKAPGNVEMKLELALRLARQGKRDSIRLCDELLDANRDSGRQMSPWLKKRVLSCKAQCLQELGDFESALATHKLVIADNLARDSTELNNLAYFRALADRELMMATEDIEKAIDRQADRGRTVLYLPLSIKAAMSIGLISRYLDRQDEAIAVLSEAISEIESDYANVQNFVTFKVYTQMQDQFPLDASRQKETRDERNQLEVIRGILASLYCVRALLYQDLDQQGKCNSDRLRIRELGFDADGLVKSLPSKERCLDALNSAMTFLDTRGFLLSRLPWDATGFGETSADDPRFRVGSYKGAISDLNLALRSTQTLKAALNGTLYNLPDFAPEDVQRMKQDVHRIEAVVLFHRMKTHRRQGNEKAANQDADEIRQLGFAPDSNLF